MTTISERQGKAVYWYLAMTDIADRSYIDEFNHWYDDIGGHVNDHMAVEGINHAWRTQEIDDSHNFGPHIQEFNTIYQCDRIGPFQMRWIPQSEETERKEDRRREGTKDWIKILFRVLDANEADEGSGSFWVRQQFDVQGAGQQEEFETYCKSEYLPAMLALDGVHRSWFLRAERGNPHQRTPHDPWDYVHVFEVDSPENLWATGRPEITDWKGRDKTANVALKRTYVSKLLSEMYEADTDPSLMVEWVVVPIEDE